jgi:FAD/FMN-containing dehydrogenase
MTNDWSNWSGSVTCQPAQLAMPASEAEVIALVQQAHAAGTKVRVFGSGHSFVPLCATGDALLSLDCLAGIESVDAERGEAVIRAGSKLHDLGEPLREHGLALANQGDVDVQSLAGAVSTGTHGTGPALGSISTQVVGLRLVAGDGRVIECSREGDSGRFSALGVSLGACGVLTAIRLRLLPAYNLHERVWREPIAECLTRLDERILATRHFEFFWYPTTDLALVKTLEPTAAEPSARRSLGGSDSNPLDGVEGERVDHNYRIFPTVRSVRFNEMEYALPAEAGPSCFAAIRNLMRERHGDVTWPIEYRTVAADGLDLSPNHVRATVAISIHQAAELDQQAFFADAEPIFRAHGGRPHWGKMHTLAATDLAPLYPRWEHFLQVRDELDPTGVFLNDHLRRLFVGA